MASEYEHRRLLGKNFYVALPIEAFAAFATMGTPPAPPLMRTLRELRTERPQVRQGAALRV
jgi:hypothetical protein